MSVEISVVIACRNEERVLPEQLAALAGQATERSWEVVLVDDASTDGSVAVAERLRPALPALVVVEQAEAQGQSSAWNEGVRRAGGTKILFTDADDVVGEGYLEAMASALERHGFVHAALELERLNPAWAVAARGHWQTDGSFSDFGFAPQAAGTTFGVTRAVLEAVGEFQTRIHTDTDYCLRAAVAGVPIRPAPGAVVHYRLRQTLAATARQAWQYGRAQGELFHAWRSHIPPGEGVGSGEHRSRGLTSELFELATARSRASRARAIWKVGVTLGRRRERVARLLGGETQTVADAAR